jgi:hypothetical protein
MMRNRIQLRQLLTAVTVKNTRRFTGTMRIIDHLMYVVSDLDSGMKAMENLTGCKTVYGGSHPGNGTCNAILPLAGQQYIEVMAPDPGQSLAGTMGEELTKLKQPGIRSWALQVEDLDTISDRLTKQGFGHSGPIAMSRTQPGGELIAWQLLFLNDARLHGATPFLIDWGSTVHPSTAFPTTESVGECSLTSLHVNTPDVEYLESMLEVVYRTVDFDTLQLQQAATVSIEATVEIPLGRAELGFWIAGD